jgi:hypothetical protein
MRVASILAIVAAVAMLPACAIDKGWLLSGVKTADQAEIRLAIRSITNSPVTDFSRHDDDPPNRCLVWTADGKVYGARKVNGKWYFWPEIIVMLRDNRSNQALQLTAHSYRVWLII